MNYTKYALKDNEELKSLLASSDDLFVVACNKCFKEFETVNEPDCDTFVQLASEQGRKITGTVKVDFLCNKLLTEKKLKDMIPEGTKNVAVISCGLGIQTVAELEEVPVLAAANTLNYTGNHGMALTEKTCGACAQCYLNLTGGICPVVDCSKGLLNGQCGGARDGKCEVDPKKDCAWEKIYQRLEKQGRQKEFLEEPVQLRDYSRVDVKAISEYVKKIRDVRLSGYNGGVHPEENKELAENLPLKKFPEPETVVIPLSMHVGKPAVPVVKAGDTVKLGQKIAEADGFVSSNIHSSVSGTVVAVEPRKHPNRGMVESIVIRSDGKNTPDESVRPNKPLEELSPEAIVDIVKEKGITGMGGAGFPTFIKLKPGKPIDTVLLNGCECEPYLTADHRVLLEYADDVIYGLKAIMKAVDAPKGIIVIEDNKPDAIALLQSRTEGIDNIEVQTVRTKYPQGAEKTLIKNVLKRLVPSGGLPADVGTVVDNVSTAVAISDAIQKGMPLVERAVSVTGEHIANPGNYMVKIGTSVKALIDYCGGITGEDVTVKMGGPMMGFPLTDEEVPVIKGTNGVIAIDTDHTKEEECIKCGRCVDVCPMELAPLNFAKYVKEGNAQALLDNHIRDCFECGCCQYICSSKIPLVERIRTGKKMIMEVK
ncbi:MAG: electron transport complex subunit RsxC [Lachnospiraceae bacterium]|nr:electron transport complex subunit RsxC [Lachnospiraceae bacterium]MDD6684355.1 electron transport complex subunit RsxC [Lachnospiraceae bacterium]MDD7048488.1 electron transport complex subunit RsxC [Lachnospiraceae bacterium]